MMLRSRVCLAIACGVMMTGSAMAAPCTPAVDVSLGTPGADSYPNLFYGTDFFAPGNPKRLLVGGGFSTIGGVADTSGVAVWDGTTFSPLGAGLRFDGTPEVYTAVTFGGSLFIGGQFAGANAFGANPQVDSRGIIRWDGSQWHQVNSNTGLCVIRSMVVYRSELYVGGTISAIGTQTTGITCIAKYDPMTNDFVTVGGGSATTGAGINDMVVYNDSLYVVGNFTQMGGQFSTRWIAKWDGNTWESVGGGIPSAASPANSPRDVLVFDDGTGLSLYVAGGKMNTAGGTSGVHKWNGQSWTAVPGVTDDPLDTSFTSSSTAVVHDGDGASIWTQVRLSQGASNVRQHMFKLERNGRFARVPGLDFGAASVFEMTDFDDGHGPKTWIGGSFTDIGGQPANRLARFTGCAQTCPADFDQNGQRTIDDIFIFINAWFQGCP
jgi:hypothetical protein